MGVCNDCQGYCKPTIRRPLVIKKREDLLWASPVSRKAPIVLSFTGNYQGQKVKCKVIAKKDSTGFGSVTFRLPSGLQGQVTIHCDHCNTTSRLVDVDTLRRT